MDRYQQHVQYGQDLPTIPAPQVGLTTWESFTGAQILDGLIRHDHTPKAVEYLDKSLKLPGDFGITAKPFRFQVNE